MKWKSNAKISILPSEAAGKARTPPALKHRLLSGGAWALGGRVGTTLSVLATNALLARLLAPQELGAYFLAFSLALFGAQAGTLGLNQAVWRFVAESLGSNQPERARRAVTLIVNLGAFGAIGVGFAYLLFGGFLAGEVFHSQALIAVTGLVAGWMTVMTLQLLLSETFRGFYDYYFATIFGSMATWAILTACLGLLWLLKGQTNLTTVMLLAIGSGLGISILASWVLSRKLAPLPLNGGRSKVRVGEILRVALPLLVANLTLIAITQADLWVLAAFRPQDEVAIYGAAARVVLLVALPLLVVNAVVPPLIAEMHAQGKTRQLERAIRSMVTLAFMPTLAALLSFVLLGSTVLGLVYGEYYREGAAVLVILSMGHLVNAWVGPCGTVLIMTGHQSTMMAITILTLAFVFGGTLWIVQGYGAPGVAGVASASMILQNALALLLARKQTGLWTHVNFSTLPVRRVFGRERG